MKSLSFASLFVFLMSFSIQASEKPKYHFNKATRQCLDADGNLGFNMEVLTQCGKLQSLQKDDWAFLDRDIRGVQIYFGQVSRSVFRNVNFGYGFIKASFLNRVFFRDTNFENTEIEQVHFKNSHFENVTFLESVFKKVSFEQSEFRRVSFKNADLKGTHFYGGSMRLVDFRDADLRGVIFDQTKIGLALWLGASFDDQTKLPFSKAVARLKGMHYKATK